MFLSFSVSLIQSRFPTLAYEKISLSDKAPKKYRWMSNLTLERQRQSVSVLAHDNGVGLGPACPTEPDGDESRTLCYIRAAANSVLGDTRIFS